jgi:hypothetical protein
LEKGKEATMTTGEGWALAHLEEYREWRERSDTKAVFCQLRDEAEPSRLPLVTGEVATRAAVLLGEYTGMHRILKRAMRLDQSTTPADDIRSDYGAAGILVRDGIARNIEDAERLLREHPDAVPTA